MDFSLKTTITRVLNTVTITRHAVTPRTIPVDVQRQIASHARIWTWSAYDHEVTVQGNGWAFTHRWNCDSQEADSYSKRYLAEKVYDFQQRMSRLERKVAA